jgi:hypothetical protein
MKKENNNCVFDSDTEIKPKSKMNIMFFHSKLVPQYFCTESSASLSLKWQNLKLKEKDYLLDMSFMKEAQDIILKNLNSRFQLQRAGKKKKK